jgi:hypothetical protein
VLLSIDGEAKVTTTVAPVVTPTYEPKDKRSGSKSLTPQWTINNCTYYDSWACMSSGGDINKCVVVAPTPIKLDTLMYKGKPISPGKVNYILDARKYGALKGIKNLKGVRPVDFRAALTGNSNAIMPVGALEPGAAPQFPAVAPGPTLAAVGVTDVASFNE